MSVSATEANLVRKTMYAFEGNAQCKQKFTKRIAEYVCDVLFQVLSHHGMCTVQTIVSIDGPPTRVMCTYSDNTAGTERVLVIPLITECGNGGHGINPLAAILYTHYLIGRAWIISGAKEQFGGLIDQLNSTIQDKFVAIHDPFNEMDDKQLVQYRYTLPASSPPDAEGTTGTVISNGDSDGGRTTVMSSGQTKKPGSPGSQVVDSTTLPRKPSPPKDGKATGPRVNRSRR